MRVTQYKTVLSNDGKAVLEKEVCFNRPDFEVYMTLEELREANIWIDRHVALY